MSLPSAQDAIRPLVLALNTSRQLLGPFSLTIAAYTFYRFTKFVWGEYIANPLNDVPGPASPSLLYGNMKQLGAIDNSVMYQEWVHQYGSTIKYRGYLGFPRLFTMDLKALNYVLTHSLTFQKSAVSRAFVSGLLGNGILVAEGHEHRKQKKIMNPAFGTSQIRELTGIFVEKALELRDVWAREIKQQSQGIDVQPTKIDVQPGLTGVTLDVIGLAGFNYKFNSLGGEKNELHEAFNTLLRSGFSFSFATFLRTILGKYYWLLPVSGDKEARQARKTMERVGHHLLNESKAAVANQGEHEIFKRRDLLSLLVKANMSTDIPANQRMTEEDVLSQIPTLLLAGHETTSTATTWALYALSIRPDFQTKLREELFTIETDNPTMEELESLPYLDAVLRETLRVYAPVTFGIRVAVQDDIIPFAKPFVDKKGRLRDTLEVRKGLSVFIPTQVVNHSVEIWGEDAMEFKPERWNSIPEAATRIPGVWGNMLTFLGGPRACIGFRFSLIETKALLFTLVRAFEFQLAVPQDDIMKKTFLTQKPVLKSDPKAGSQMPLLVVPHVRAD